MFSFHKPFESIVINRRAKREVGGAGLSVASLSNLASPPDADAQSLSANSEYSTVARIRFSFWVKKLLPPPVSFRSFSRN